LKLYLLRNPELTPAPSGIGDATSARLGRSGPALEQNEAASEN
jgi:hypothetical protein